MVCSLVAVLHVRDPSKACTKEESRTGFPSVQHFRFQASRSDRHARRDEPNAGADLYFVQLHGAC